mgnify:CR=1 FL=1
MKQTDLEREMVELGKSRYWAAVHKARELGIESTTSPGQRLLSEAVTLMSDALEDWMKEAEARPGRMHRAHQYISLLPPQTIAAITARCVLDCISKARKIASTAHSVARLLEDELKFSYIKNNEPALWNHIHRNIDRHKSYETKAKFIKNTARYNDIVFDAWPKKDAVEVGIVCIELLRQATGIIDVSTRGNRWGRAVTMVVPSPDLLVWLKNSHEKCELLKPVHLPMITQPNDWGPNKMGGYLSPALLPRGIVKSHNRKYIEELNTLSMPKVYRAINSLQRTPLSIDGELIKVIRYFWDNGYAVGGLPSSEDAPLPTKPDDIKTNEVARKAWRREAARTHFENERQQSKRLQVSKVLYLADKFGGITLHYPHEMDFRGRDYPIGAFLQPQGPDWARSMLRFARGVAITDDNGVAWLAVHAANKWGHDKVNFNDRVKWVEENERMIRAVAKDPFRNMEWCDADSPFHFLAAAREWSAFLDHGMGFVSSLPVSQDATTQGLQIYAKLLLDPVAGHATNVLPRDTPGDIYQDVADLVVNKLRASTDPYASTWLSFGINRKTTKRQTMTLTYGAVFYSCHEYTTEWFYEQLSEGRTNPFGDETYRPCRFLATLIWEAIGEVVKSAQVGMAWLREVATVFMDNDITMKWTTPNGFLVQMDYPNMRKHEVKTSIGPVVRRHRINVETAGRDKRKNVNAIAANYVHSLDGLGGLLGEIICMAKDQGIDDILACHDNGSVHAQHVGLFGGCIRQSAYNIFQGDLLSDFRDQVTHLLPSDVHLPDAPERGNMDLTKVLDSMYYWN